MFYWSFIGWAVYLYKIEPYTGLLMYHIIPSIILIVSNGIILSKLRFARSARGNMTTGNPLDVWALKQFISQTCPQVDKRIWHECLHRFNGHM